MDRLSLTHQAHVDRTDAERDVRIALLGCGTVGSGVARLLVSSESSVPARSGVDYWLSAIAVRSLAKPRPPEIPASLFTEDAESLVGDPSIDVVIECIGGTGVAARLVEAALRAGKHVVTANKDLLATRGPELRALAAERRVTIAYEAAVGGAIPIVRTIAESLAGEEILEVGGVLNGTTNFILSKMFEGQTYQSALAQAQRLGFAEADPTNDVEGIDAAPSRRPDQQIRIGHVRCVEMAVDIDFRNLVEPQTFPLHFFRKTPKNIDQFRSAAVIQCQGQCGPCVVPGRVGRPAHTLPHLVRQLVRTSHVLDAHVVIVHALHIVREVAFQQPHQKIHFRLWPLQVVLQGESVEGQPRQTDAGRGFHHVLDRLGARPVPKESLQAALSCPAPIAVHNDGDVVGQPLRIETAINRCLIGGQFMNSAGIK